MIKLFLKIVLGCYNFFVFALLNAVMFFNHMWRPRRWTNVAIPQPVVPASIDPFPAEEADSC